jgi:hypothetical protein
MSRVVIRCIARSARLRRAAGIAGAGLALLPAAAHAQCPDEPVTQPYLALGDDGWYFEAPGGDFEGPMQWSASGSWALETGSGRPAAFGHRQHLRLGHGAAATSPRICVDADRTHLRFGVQAAEGAGRLTVQAVEKARTTTLGWLDGADRRTWAVSPHVPLATALGVAPGTTRTVRLRFSVQRTWRIDAVAIDPRRAG